jgi:integrase
MSNSQNIIFQSCLAPWFTKFLQEKRALGIQYASEPKLLRQIDRLLQKESWQVQELPRSILESWVSPQPYHTLRTLAIRRTLARQLALFLIRNDIPAYIFPPKEERIIHSSYVPWIFSQGEIKRLLDAADSLPFCGQSPLRQRIIPELLRILYGCGLRLSEALHLQVRDVDLPRGILTIREGKGNNDRLVPLAYSLKERLTHYAKVLEDCSPEDPFFPSPNGGFYSPNTMYATFRVLLENAGISHGGRGHGPRLHDLRHTMACHRLIKWYREGVDINAKLPLLATYLGHRHLSGTQRYLHLTAELFPDLTTNLESAVGHIIPRRSEP